jgi:hypothetical protein
MVINQAMVIIPGTVTNPVTAISPAITRMTKG